MAIDALLHTPVPGLRVRLLATRVADATLAAPAEGEPWPPTR